jgi:pimeloyl-ACP methyl ester carboxylesterase
MSSYVQLGEVRTYYEEDGSGAPLVLLHPGHADSRAFEVNLPGLIDRFRVFRPDRRGHGRTPDVEGPITYEQMAQDTIAFFEQVVGGPAHLVGHSDGAVVALVVALRRPDLVRRLVFGAGVFHHDGWRRARSTWTRRPPLSSSTTTARSPLTGPSTSPSSPPSSTGCTPKSQRSPSQT